MTTPERPARPVDRVRPVLAPHVAAGAVPGLAWRVERDGEVDRGALGTSDPGGAGTPVTPETPFRLASVTKPVVAVAAMTLVEDGTLPPDAPVDRWLPELADREVVVAPGDDLTRTVPAARPVLVRDVLELRLGVGYDFTGGPTAVLDRLEQRGLPMGPPAPQAAPPPDEWMRLLGSVPLMAQPGERWLYQIGAEVLGVLLARAAGVPLPRLLRERLLDPVGMHDTGFAVPAGRRDRFGTLWAADDGGGLRAYDPPDGQWSTEPAFPNAADGLVSTVDDLAALAGVLRHGGVLPGGGRLLEEGTFRELVTSRVTVDVDEVVGWGLGVGVRVADGPEGRHAGSFGWDGGTGCSWWTDPVTGTSAVLLTNQMWDSPTPPAHVQAFWRTAFSPDRA